jgi:uncharacterized protein YggT (Ycf19 family)
MAIMFLVLLWLTTFFIGFSHWLIWMMCCCDEPNTNKPESIDQEMEQFCEDLLTSVREMKSDGGTIRISFSPGPDKNID